MRREEMQHVPHERSGLEVQRVYGEVARASIELAEYIRAMGWPAHAYGDPRSTEALQIPMAVRAGLGQLGKHGSMISKDYGSNFRLAAVGTNIPLSLDSPVDIGVDDLCLGCRRCTIDCPPDAIPMRSNGCAANTAGTWISTNACLISPRLTAARSV